MNREDFAAFVATTLDDGIQLAEEKCGQELSHKIAFRWLGGSHRVVSDNIVEHIVGRVFVDEEHIYPCVDIGVGDVLEDGTLLIVGNVAGYPPRPFGQNWTGRVGPFVRTVGGPFLNKMAGKKDSWSPSHPFAYITSDMQSPISWRDASLDRKWLGSYNLQTILHPILSARWIFHPSSSPS